MYALIITCNRLGINRIWLYKTACLLDGECGKLPRRLSLPVADFPELMHERFGPERRRVHRDVPIHPHTHAQKKSAMREGGKKITAIDINSRKTFPAPRPLVCRD